MCGRGLLLCNVMPTPSSLAYRNSVASTGQGVQPVRGASTNQLSFPAYARALANWCLPIQFPSGLTLNQAVEKLRGPVDTKIKLTIIRKGSDKPIEVTIVRAVIRVKSVRSHREGDDVGYIRIAQFNEQTTDGLKKAIADLTGELGADKVKGFVIDLRNNPGGLLDQAISVSDAFLDKGEIVSIRGRNAEETQRFNARPGDLTKGKPLIVLINGGSASASEIVAGALQDNKRATLVGTRSFGKGPVQTIIPLGAGNGALRLTTARYFTPSGRSIQAKGITPDIKILQEVPDDLKARTDVEGEASLPSRRKAARNRARSLTCRRTRRTTARSRKRSICCAAPSPMRRSRPTQRPQFLTKPSEEGPSPVTTLATFGRQLVSLGRARTRSQAQKETPAGRGSAGAKLASSVRAPVFNGPPRLH